MGWVEQHGRGFRGRVEFAGQRLSTDTAPTRPAAKKLLLALERELHDPNWLDPAAGNIVFREWVEEWRKTRQGLATATRVGDESRLRIHLLPAFGDLLLTEIDALKVRQWASELSKTRSAKTVRHCHALLHGVMQLAVDSERIRRNPCVGTRLPTPTRKEQVILDPHDLAVFVDCFTHPVARALVETKAGTGMRWGEVAGLRVMRVDLPHRKLVVREVLEEAEGVLRFKETPKTDSSYRTITLPHTVVDALRPLVAGRSPDELVFVSRDCAGSCRHCEAAEAEIAEHGLTGRLANDRRRLVHAFRNRNFRRDHWDPAIKAAAARGMTLRPTPHDLRHTHASLLIAQGLHPVKIQRRLGHKSITVTMDVYGHLFPDSDVDVLAALNKVLPAARGRTFDDELADLLS